MKRMLFLILLVLTVATAASAEWQGGMLLVAQNDEGQDFIRPEVRDRYDDGGAPMTTIPSTPPESTVPMQPASSSRTWTDPVTKMRFVRIPGGCFMMGQTDAERRWLIQDAGQDKYKSYYADEAPRHEVCVDGYWIGAYEVTRGQFAQFVRATGYRTDAERQGKAWVKDKSTSWKWKQVPGRSWRNIGYNQDDSHPAVAISFNDAKSFAAWLQRTVGGEFRLPTEAEWEYAARAGSSSKWFWGDDPTMASRYANVAGKGEWTNHFPMADGHQFTSPVGYYQPNRFGLYDMLGNVWEWCEDYYNSAAYRDHARRNPRFMSGTQYVNRGGSWLSWPRTVRCGDRISRQPNQPRSSVGFRLVRVR